MRRVVPLALLLPFLTRSIQADPHRLPHLPPPQKNPDEPLGAVRVQMDDGPSAPVIVGNLLFPQQNTLLAPNLLFAQHKNALHIFDTAADKELTKPQVVAAKNNIETENGLELPSDKPVTLLGAADTLAILVQDTTAIAIDLKTVTIAWKSQAAGTAFALTPSRLLALDGKTVTALHAASGKPAWKIDAEKPTFIGAAKNHLAIQAEDPNAILLLDEATGAATKTIPLETPPLFAAIAQDGTVIVILKNILAAYSLDPAQANPLWRIENFQSRFPSATLVTPDSLLVVRKRDEPACLSLKTGEVLWPPAHTVLRLSPPGHDSQRNPLLHAHLDGDKVLYTSPDTLEAFFLKPSPGDQVAWRAQVPKDLVPPMQSLQFSDNYVIALASGPLHDIQRSVCLLFYDQAGGRMRLRRPIVSGDANAKEGPGIRAWQVLDNAVALEVNGVIYAYRAKKP